MREFLAQFDLIDWFLIALVGAIVAFCVVSAGGEIYAMWQSRGAS